MMYLYIFGGAVFWFLLCFVTPRFQGLALFYVYKAAGLKSDADRDDYIRFYSRALNVFGVVLAIVFILVLVRRSLN